MTGNAVLVPVLIVPADQELQIARQTAAVVGGEGQGGGQGGGCGRG